MFVLECIPKDNIDSGIVNLGYVKDAPPNESQPRWKSLNVALRVNKPEFIFLIETASHKKRFFITRCELLLDYTVYNNSASTTVALSGLHTIFCDYSMSSSEPYLVLKHCDFELCQSVNNDKNNKVDLKVSTVYIQIYNRVISTLIDVLNDIAEHFKVPEGEQTNNSVPETEELWEPKKLIECVPKCNEDYVEKETDQQTIREVCIVPCIDFVLIMELQEIPVLCFKATAEISLYNWSYFLNCTTEFTLQANYYNESLQTWEPFIDPVAADEGDYRPWDVTLKIFQDKSLSMLQITDRKAKKEAGKRRKRSHSSTVTEDEDSGEDMLYLEPANLYSSRNSNRVKTSLSAFLDDSDSETEDFTMEKLATAISDLFTGDWNESEESDESESTTDSNDESEVNKAKANKKRNYPKKWEKSTYVIFTGTERLDFTITPTFLKIVSDLVTEYSGKTLSVICDRNNIKLVNDIGPNSTIELHENSGDAEQKTIICTKTYEKQDSPPNSPTRRYSDYDDDDYSDYYCMEDLHEIKFEHQRESEPVNSLKFAAITTPQLYEKVNKHVLRINIEGFPTFQTNCSNRNWEKLIKIQAQDSGQFYHLAARHTVGKDGRNIVVGSPLQVLYGIVMRFKD